MWYLKIRYKHDDCLFTDKIHALKLSLFHYYLGAHVKGKFVYVTGFQKLEGDEKNIEKYVSYLKKSKNVEKIEVYDRSVLVLVRNERDARSYEWLYNPMFTYPAPATVDKAGFEIVQVAYWEKKPLQDLIAALKKDKATTHLEILSFVEKKLDDLYVSRLLPKLAAKQRRAIQLAFEHGYYSFPRKIGLVQLAKLARVSKPTFRENLRRAEAKLLPFLFTGE